MTTAFIVAALVAVLIALAFVLIPLMTGGNPEAQRIRRQLRALEELTDQLDPDDLRQRRARLEAALADSGNDGKGVGLGIVLALLIAVPVATVLMYRHVGSPEGLTPGGTQVEEIRAGLVELAHAIERNPHNIDNWVRLGMVYKDLQEFSSAEHAFRRALYEAGDNEPFIQVELAETLLFASRGGAMPSEARRLLARAISTDPENQKALWLLGIGAFQNGDMANAVRYWQRLEGLLEPGSVKNSVQAQLQRARQQMIAGGPDAGARQDRELPEGHPPIAEGSGPVTARPMPEGHPPMETPPAVAGSPGGLPEGHPPIDEATDERPGASPDDGPVLPIQVDISSELAEQLNGREVVFVTARAADGPPTPLAVRRLSVADLPARFGFSDNDAMLEGMSLSNHPDIIVTARVSMHGQPEARPGDLQGQAGPLSIYDVAEVQVTIDQVLE